MARRWTMAAVLALGLLVAVLVTGGDGRADRAAAATGPCVQHTKRVVKYVKRHGRRVRVVRPKHYWTCAEAPAPTAPPALSPTPTSAEPAPSAPAPTLPSPVVEAPKVEPPPQPEPEPNALGVVAEDSNRMLRYSLSRPTVKPGRLVVQLTNRGEDPHAMDMQRVGPNGEPEGPIIAELAAEPGEAAAPTTVEVQPGTYRLWCTIGHHAEHGMETDVTVTE